MLATELFPEEKSEFGIEDLLKSGMLMSNASRNPNNSHEWDVKLYLVTDELTPSGRAMKALLEQVGVWFDD